MNIDLPPFRVRVVRRDIHVRHLQRLEVTGDGKELDRIGESYSSRQIPRAGNDVGIEFVMVLLLRLWYKDFDETERADAEESERKLSLTSPSRSRSPIV